MSMIDDILPLIRSDELTIAEIADRLNQPIEHVGAFVGNYVRNGHIVRVLDDLDGTPLDRPRYYATDKRL